MDGVPQLKMIPPKDADKPVIMGNLIKCQAEFEGFAEGTRAWRNNNPCNMKEPYTWTADAWSSKDGGGFLIFDTVEDGWRNCEKIPAVYIKHNPQVNLKNYIHSFANTSPVGERNNYIDSVSKCMGVEYTAQLNSITQS